MSAFTDLLAQARESGCLPMGLTFDQETAEDLEAVIAALKGEAV